MGKGTRRMMIWLLLVLPGLYAVACLALYLRQRSMIYFPQPRSFDAPLIKLDVPGVRLHVTVRERAGKKALVYFGGNGEDVTASLPSLSMLFPDHALYLMHYRSYGGSTGKPSEEALAADALLLFDRVHAAHPDVTAFGRSLGSGLAVRLASVRPVSQLILVTPYDSLADIAAGRFPFFPIHLLINDKFESWRYAPKVTAPTILIVAQHDNVIPEASSAQLLTRFAPGVARYKVIPEAGHNSISGYPAYEDVLAVLSQK
jgi:pimeloyl-ACP methyl ester carboxylesterase